MKNLMDYITILKIVRNTHTNNLELQRIVYNVFFEMVANPMLFNNLSQLFEVDALHRDLGEFVIDFPLFASPANYLGPTEDENIKFVKHAR